MPAPTATLGDALALVRTLGAPPIGSPAAVREHAVHLRRVADQLETSANLLRASAHVDGYLGPAARRHEEQTRHEAAVMTQRIQRLRDLAARLEAEAGRLQGRQSAWRSSFAGRAAALPGSLAHQALSHLGWKLP
jgi:hypothetical protein